MGKEPTQFSFLNFELKRLFCANVYWKDYFVFFKYSKNCVLKYKVEVPVWVNLWVKNISKIVKIFVLIIEDKKKKDKILIRWRFTFSASWNKWSSYA